MYERILAELAARRKELQARLIVIEASAALPPLDAITEGEKIAEVLRRVAAVHSAGELTPAEKYLILSKVIKSITPKEEGYSVKFVPSPASGWGGGEYISIR